MSAARITAVVPFNFGGPQPDYPIPQDAEDQFYIHPDECIDCGACEPECPVQAIFPDTDVPAEWTNYIEKNKAHFD